MSANSLKFNDLHSQLAEPLRTVYSSATYSADYIAKFRHSSSGTVIKSSYEAISQEVVARGVNNCLLKEWSRLESFGRRGWDGNDVVPGTILTTDDLVIPYSMKTWEKRSRWGARPIFTIENILTPRVPYLFGLTDVLPRQSWEIC